MYGGGGNSCYEHLAQRIENITFEEWRNNFEENEPPTCNVIGGFVHSQDPNFNPTTPFIGTCDIDIYLVGDAGHKEKCQKFVSVVSDKINKQLAAELTEKNKYYRKVPVLFTEMGYESFLKENEDTFASKCFNKNIDSAKSFKCIVNDIYKRYKDSRDETMFTAYCIAAQHVYSIPEQRNRLTPSDKVCHFGYVITNDKTNQTYLTIECKHDSEALPENVKKDFPIVICYRPSHQDVFIDAKIFNVNETQLDGRINNFHKPGSQNIEILNRKESFKSYQIESYDSALKRLKELAPAYTGIKRYRAFKKIIHLEGLIDPNIIAQKRAAEAASNPTKRQKGGSSTNDTTRRTGNYITVSIWSMLAITITAAFNF